MKILINKTDKNILPITKIYNLGSVTTTIDDLLNESTITLEKNITPILSIDGSNYLINNFNPNNYKEDFEILLTESDLITFGNSTDGDYIPLSGTTVGNPVSGNIEIVGAGADLRIFSMGDSDILQNNITFGDGVFAFGVKNLIDGGGSSIQVYENYIEVNAQNDSVGIKGSEDFTLNITDLDYTQKKYVDSQKPYKVYTALLTQTGTDAPVATVLENTLGETVVLSYDGVGTYSATLIGAFINNKVFLSITHSDQLADSDTVIYRIDIDSISIETSTGGVLQDQLLSDTSIEIRVYN